ncbi:MAG: acyl-CoA carboxylase subunit beta [Opitutales bacterium]|jgi:propionyl-CoA carboxylase beta chain
MAIQRKLLEELENRRKAALAGGGEKKIQARHEKGQLTARERIDALYEPDTFQEFGMHADHACTHFGMEERSMPGDGVVTGTGMVDGRPVATFAHDFTIGGAALGRIQAKKVVAIMKYAVETGMPVVGINDSGGARIQEGVDSLSGYGEIFYHNVLLSGVVPQISIIAGPCAGGAVYSPALCDFLIMVRNKATNMFICGPSVIHAATGENAKLEQFASADAHASVSGNIHLVADDDAHAVALAHKLLSFLPSNNISEPPHKPTSVITVARDEGMNELVPEDPKLGFDVKQVIARLVDGADFFEIMANFAKNIVIGFARIEGIVVGIIANQPAFKAGCLDIDSSDKAARFIRTCNVFNIPIVNLVDVPGFMPGLAQERGGIIRHGAKMLFAYASASVPKITVIMRKAYGGAYLAMCSADMGADMVFAWPCAEIAVMGAEGAVKVLYKDQLEKAENPEKLYSQFVEDYKAKFASPYQAAQLAMITDVIEPAMTRPIVAMALRNTLSKRVTRPGKKHGNIPL